MAFKKKTWKDRMVEYAGRRKLTNVSTGASQIMDVERAEGTVSEEGSAFSAASMNDLEQRIGDEFGEISSNLKGFTPIVDSTGRITGYKTEAGADTVFPFSGGKYQIVLTATLAGYKYDTQSGGYTGISSQKNITITMIYENGKCTLKNQNEEFETDIVWYDSPRSAGLFNIRIASVTKLDN